MIFALAAEGMSLRKIAQALDAAGIIAPGAKGGVA